MITIKSEYLGQLRTLQTHVASGSSFQTDAPIDNKGKGELFSPTDTVCAALASCMMTIMGIAAETHGFELRNIKADVIKEMASNPRRIARIRIKFYNFGIEYDNKQREIIEKAARNCPVALSLSAELIQEINFDWNN